MESFFFAFELKKITPFGKYIIYNNIIVPKEKKTNVNF